MVRKLRKIKQIVGTILCVFYLLTFISISISNSFLINHQDQNSLLHINTNESNISLLHDMAYLPNHSPKDLFTDDTNMTFLPVSTVPPLSRTLTMSWSHLCALNEDTPSGNFLVVLVHSHVLNCARRHAIRDTWGRITRDYDSPRHVQIIFLVGLPENPDDQILVKKEMTLYRDILQWRFIDNYKNLSLKSILGIQWVLENCDKCPYIMKADDDVYLNVSMIVNFLQQDTRTNLNTDDNLVGHVNRKSPVLRIGQWGVSVDSYPFQTYPPYCSGAAYVMSRATARRIVTSMTQHGNMTVLPVEDVFVTGILASLGGVTCRHEARLPGWMTQVSLDSVQELLNAQLFGVHGVAEHKMRLVWKLSTQCQQCRQDTDLIETILTQDTDYEMYYDNIDEGFTDL